MFYNHKRNFVGVPMNYFIDKYEAHLMGKDFLHKKLVD